MKKYWTEGAESKIPVEIPCMKSLETMARFISPEDYYYFIFDLAESCVKSVSGRVENVLGYEPAQFDITTYLDRMEPRDLEKMHAKEATGRLFFTEFIAPELMNKYKIVYTFRIRRKDGRLINILHQSMPIHKNTVGRFRYTLNIDMDISHWKLPECNRVSFISTNGQRSYYNIDPFNPDFEAAGDSAGIFTRREIEVLEAIAAGATNPMIAEQLSVSRNTVDTHRKNLLRKSGYSNITQLIADCVRQGII